MERSMRSSTTADTNTGKDSTPNTAVIKNAQIVKGRRVMLMPLVRRLITVTM